MLGASDITAAAVEIARGLASGDARALDFILASVSESEGDGCGESWPHETPAIAALYAASTAAGASAFEAAAASPVLAGSTVLCGLEMIVPLSIAGGAVSIDFSDPMSPLGDFYPEEKFFLYLNRVRYSGTEAKSALCYCLGVASSMGILEASPARMDIMERMGIPGATKKSINFLKTRK